MILYLDASALVKRYVAEKESEQVNAWIEAADIVITGLITRVEVAAAFARAGRMEVITSEDAAAALSQFRSEWENLLRLPVTEQTVARGDFLAGKHNLRGYDATHLASALIWQETLDETVTVVSFDKQLSRAAFAENMNVLPRLQ